MNSAVFQNLFDSYNDISSLVKQLNSLSWVKTEIDIPRILVVGPRGSGVSSIVKLITGFSTRLRNITNPVEYRFRNDPDCCIDEVYCSVEGHPIEFKLCQFDSFLDVLHSKTEWETIGKPIIVLIRASCVPNIDVVDLPRLVEDAQTKQYLADPSAVILNLDQPTCFGRSGIQPTDSKRTISCSVAPAMSAAVRHSIRRIMGTIVWNQVSANQSPKCRRDQIRDRLSVLGIAIPYHDDGKRMFLGAMFGELKAKIEKRFDEYVIEDTELIENFISSVKLYMNENSKPITYLELVDQVTDAFIGICEKTTREVFTRFPLVIEQVHKCWNPVAVNVASKCRGAVEGAVEFLINNLKVMHFQLVHDFECPDGVCQKSCAYQSLADALVKGLAETVPRTLVHAGKRMESEVVGAIDKQFSSLLPLFELLGENEETTAERITLMNELRILHNAYVLFS